jgi:hypothetical protein
MTYTCAIDQTSHESLDALHAYVKTSYRLSQKAYWTGYAPRADKLTGEPIPFKDAEQYLSADFTDKNHLRKWLKEQPREVGLTWAKSWLAQRRASKGLTYAPSQAELRTLCTPTMPFFEKVAAAEGGYYGVTSALGFKPRFIKAPLTFNALPADALIVQDTREQAPIALAHATQIGTVEVGDYAIAQPFYDKGIRIERKSLSDFCGTLSGRKQVREGKTKTTEWSNLERFERELARAAESNLYVVMMVENTIEDAQRFNYLPQTKWVKASPAYIFHNLRDLLQRYPLSFQVLFVDGRKEMAAKMLRVFQLGEQVRTTDLQFALEEGLL